MLPLVYNWKSDFKIKSYKQVMKVTVSPTGKVTKITVGSQEAMTTTGLHVAGCCIHKNDAVITVMQI